MELIKIYHKLSKHFGKQYWWPAETPFEVMIGAILTQNANWNNVVKAIQNLKNENLLNPPALDNVNIRHLENAIRSVGFYKQKAKRLKHFVRYLKTHYNYNINRFFDKSKMHLREELLRLKGIGRETADSIILYAAQKPVFVIDAYTKRMCHRLGITQITDYESLRDFFENRLPENIKIYNEFHALIVELGKNYCRKKPLCENCLLKGGCRYMRRLGNRQNKIFQVKKFTQKFTTKARKKTKTRKK